VYSLPDTVGSLPPYYPGMPPYYPCYRAVCAPCCTTVFGRKGGYEAQRVLFPMVERGNEARLNVCSRVFSEG